MKILNLIPLLTTLLLTSCVHVSHSNIKKEPSKKSSSRLITLSNEGTMCATKLKSSILIKYYPLSSNCVSSSANSWKLNGFDTKVDGNNLRVDSYSLYKKSNSPIATADCGGARVVVKKVEMPTKTTTLYWGDTKLGVLLNNKTACYKRVGSSYKVVKPFR